MTAETKFYTSCMKNEIYPGYVAEMVGQAGRMIGGVGNIFTTYGEAGAFVSALILAGRSVAAGQWRDEIPLSEFAITSLKHSGALLRVRVGLALIGKTLTNVGRLMQARETQCTIGQGLGGRSEL